jgi:putative acetyltransferase
MLEMLRAGIGWRSSTVSCESGAVLIRRERPGDEAGIFAIQAQGFGVDRSGDNPPVEATLVDELRADPQAWIPRLSLVAEAAGRPIGHVVCSRAWLRAEVPVLALGPIAVLPEYQANGVGTALVHAVCAAADALDEPMVVLLGSPDYYSRTGFVLAERLAVTPPVPAWSQHLQVRTLAGYDADVHHGSFRYSAPFGRL